MTMRSLPMARPLSTAGFSLLELLLVIALLAIVGGIGSTYYFNIVKDLELASAADTLIEDLRRTQNGSMTGENGRAWGVHFVNGADDLYQVFSTLSDFAGTSTIVVNTVYLPASILFSDPIEGTTKDVVFARITGAATSTSITIASPDNNKTITIPASGHTY